MKSFVTPGTVAGLLACASMAAAAFGKSELAAFLGSPEAATAVTSIVTGVLVLAAGILPGKKAA